MEGLGVNMSREDSSELSNVDSSKEEISEAFLFILDMVRGLTGVPSHECCL